MSATTQVAARVDRVIRHYGFAEPTRKTWRGQVVRLEELTDEDRISIGAAPRGAANSRSVHLTWRCVNALCGQWTMDGAYLRGRCNFCDEPRGAA